MSAIIFERLGHVVAEYATGYDVAGGETIILDGVTYPIILVDWTIDPPRALLGDPL